MPPRKKSGKSARKKPAKKSKKAKKSTFPESPRAGTWIIVLAICFLSFGFWQFFSREEPPQKKAEQTETVQKKAKKEKKASVETPKKKAVPAPSPALVFVIDDIGYNLDHVKALRDLGSQVTYAILPQLSYSEYFGNLSSVTGAEVILHLPLEAVDGTIPGNGLITTDMPEEEVLAMLDADLKTVPHHSGINNHMGSLGTSDMHLMRILVAEMKKRQLLFLDSRTSSSSVAAAVGNEISIPVFIRDTFLDNVDEKDAIREQVYELAETARQNGFAIGIGHYRANTLQVLAEEIPDLKAKGFRIVSLGELAKEVF